MLGAFQLAELGATIPRSGGQYVFARHALGEYAGFVVGWSDWISTCGTAAAVALVIGEFSGALVPSLKGRALSISVGITVLFAILQWRGIRWGSAVQNITSLAKTIAFLALIVAAFALGGDTVPGVVTVPPTLGGAALVGAFVVALQGVIYTYDGWNGMVYFSEEARDPGKDVPRSLIVGVVVILVIYLLVNVAFLYVLPVSSLAGRDFAAGAVAEALFGRYGDSIFRALAIVSMLSSINANHLMASRVLFAMSRDGLVTPRAATVNKGGTPTVALFISTVVAVLFIAFGQTFGKVITVLAFFFVANYTLSFVSVFVLRVREPDRPRPYRAWGYPWTTALALAGSTAFLVGAAASDTRNSVYALALLAASYPVYRITRLSR